MSRPFRSACVASHSDTVPGFSFALFAAGSTGSAASQTITPPLFAVAGNYFSCAYTTPALLPFDPRLSVDRTTKVFAVSSSILCSKVMKCYIFGTSGASKTAAKFLGGLPTRPGAPASNDFRQHITVAPSHASSVRTFSRLYSREFPCYELHFNSLLGEGMTTAAVGLSPSMYLGVRSQWP